MNQVYLIGGLGADDRVFTSLMAVLPNAIFLPWLRPLPSEDLSQYSNRFSERIDSEAPTIIGVSFGGIIACEIARLRPDANLILISTVKNSTELPCYYRIAGRFGIHRCIPFKLLKYTSRINYLLFGVEKANRTLLQQIIADTDPIFLKWAVEVILKWESRCLPGNYLHLHGTKDRILPIRFTNFAKAIPGAGHFMIVDRAEELTHIILRRLALNRSNTATSYATYHS